jgi:hypothetical protein
MGVLRWVLRRRGAAQDNVTEEQPVAHNKGKVRRVWMMLVAAQVASFYFSTDMGMDS